MIEFQQYTTTILEKLSEYDIPELIQDSFILGYLEFRNQGRIFQFFLNQLDMLKNLRELQHMSIYNKNQINNLYNKVVNQNADLSVLCQQLEADTFDKNQVEPKSIINPQSQIKFKQEAVNYNQQGFAQNHFQPQILQQPQNNNQIQGSNGQKLQQSQNLNTQNFGFEFQDFNQLQQMVDLESNIRKIDLDKNSQKFALSLQEQFDAEEAKRIAKADEENNIKIECQICLELIPIDEMATLSCTHIYHTKCLNQYCTTQIQARQFPIICPSIECKKNIKYDDLTEVLDDVSLNEFQTLSFKTYVETHGDEYSWCPTPDCSYIFIAAGFNQLDCPVCKKSYCLNCRAEFHFGLSCQQYVDKIKQENQVNDQEIFNLGQQQGIGNFGQPQVGINKQTNNQGIGNFGQPQVGVIKQENRANNQGILNYSLPQAGIVQQANNQGFGNSGQPQVGIIQQAKNFGQPQAGIIQQVNSFGQPQAGIIQQANNFGQPQAGVIQQAHNQGIGNFGQPQAAIIQQAHNQGIGNFGQPQAGIIKQEFKDNNQGILNYGFPQAGIIKQANNQGISQPQVGINKQVNNQGIFNYDQPQVGINKQANNQGIGNYFQPYVGINKQENRANNLGFYNYGQQQDDKLKQENRANNQGIKNYGQQQDNKIKQQNNTYNQRILDDQFLEFVRGAKFKQCPQCKFWVEKNQGCDHMTCRCKFQFCYVCGGTYLQCACVKRRR